jgi:phytoene dehydrogenase-like protein
MPTPTTSSDRPWRRPRYDAVVIGAGPNGLAAAALLARAGIETLVVEARATPGGGTRTSQLTVPGYHHDVCSSVHPLGVASPCFRDLALHEHGVAWIHPRAPMAHLLGDDRVVMLERSLDETARGLGRDGRAYRDHTSSASRSWSRWSSRRYAGHVRRP